MPEAVNLWQHPEHAARYLARSQPFPGTEDGRAELIRHLPERVERVLDLGCGDGRLLASVQEALPGCGGVATDVNPVMLDAAETRFAHDARVEVIRHDLDHPLPSWEPFDVVVSSFAIHHLIDERKRSLYHEVFDLLHPGGTFLNVEHVASPTDRLHIDFLEAMGVAPEDDDPSNKLAPVELQLVWLREIGFVDVDCHWKWLELALLGGRKPVPPGLAATG
jgi:SAM-dependent methyltransferase